MSFPTPELAMSSRVVMFRHSPVPDRPRSNAHGKRSRFAALVALSAVSSWLLLDGRSYAVGMTPYAIDGAISVVGEAAPTVAWTDYCHRFPGECSVDSSEPAVIPFTRALWNVLVSINTRVNASVKPRTDQQHWGVEDRWDFPDDGFGDCEDFQIFKRKLLVQAGLPRRALRIAVVIDEEGAGHAVLMVRTDRGDLVLDNKTDAVLPWAETGYRYVKRESDAEGVWVLLGGRTSPLSTANRRQPIAAQADPR